MNKIKNSSLQPLFEAIAQAQTEADLSQSVMEKVGTHFAANRWRLWLMHQILTEQLDSARSKPADLNNLNKNNVDKKSDRLIEQALSLEKNPVLRYLVERHTAVHDEVVLPPGVWKTICPRADHGHVMVGPVISQGKLIGGIAVTRHRTEPAFDTEDLADLSALSLHFSTHLMLLKLSSSNLSSPNLSSAGARQAVSTATKMVLTPRETQIAELVAQGLTNKKIGSALWITENSVKQALKRMFRKLNVSSRAEMVAQLASGSQTSGLQTLGSQVLRAQASTNRSSPS